MMGKKLPATILTIDQFYHDKMAVAQAKEYLLALAVKTQPISVDNLAKLLYSDDGVEVKVSSLKKSRTRPQEAYYRKWAREFGKFCGLLPDEMHDVLLRETFGTVEVETKFGVRLRPDKRSAGTTRAQYGELIDTTIRLAAEMGFNIPPPHRDEDD